MLRVLGPNETSCRPSEACRCGLPQCPGAGSRVFAQSRTSFLCARRQELRTQFEFPVANRLRTDPRSVYADHRQAGSEPLQTKLTVLQPLPILVTDAPLVPLAHLDDLWFQVGGTLCNLECTHCFISCSPHNHSFGFLSLAAVRSV